MKDLNRYFVLEKIFQFLINNPDIELNVDDQYVDTMIEALAKRRAEFGYAYCPCRFPYESEGIDSDIICPCSFVIKEVIENGRCKCNLFKRKSDA